MRMDLNELKHFCLHLLMLIWFELYNKPCWNLNMFILDKIYWFSFRKKIQTYTSRNIISSSSIHNSYFGQQQSKIISWAITLLASPWGPEIVSSVSASQSSMADGIFYSSNSSRKVIRLPSNWWSASSVCIEVTVWKIADEYTKRLRRLQNQY